MTIETNMYVRTNKGIICKILKLNELFEIQNGNKKVLYEHIKAISNIFNIAKKELEEGEEVDESNDISIH